MQRSWNSYQFEFLPDQSHWHNPDSQGKQSKPEWREHKNVIYTAAIRKRKGFSWGHSIISGHFAPVLEKTSGQCRHQVKPIPAGLAPETLVSAGLITRSYFCHPPLPHCLIPHLEYLSTPPRPRHSGWPLHELYILLCQDVICLLFLSCSTVELGKLFRKVTDVTIHSSATVISTNSSACVIQHYSLSTWDTIWHFISNRCLYNKWCHADNQIPKREFWKGANRAVHVSAPQGHKQPSDRQAWQQLTEEHSLRTDPDSLEQAPKKKPQRHRTKFRFRTQVKTTPKVPLRSNESSWLAPDLMDGNSQRISHSCNSSTNQTAYSVYGKS